jgi:hypothetical protein
MQIAVAQDVDDLFEAGEQRIETAQAQQVQIDQIVEVTQDRFQEFQTLQREVEDLRVYNNLLQAQVDAQNRELTNLYEAIDNVGLIERQILPLMRRMINGLERFVALGPPFLVDDRTEMVAFLRRLLLRADVTVASQFNNVLAAWLDEVDYGTNGDVYIDNIVTPDGRTREVEILRIGTVALIYLTPDGGQAGAWDKRAGNWVPLDPTLISQIQIGIDSYKTEQPALFVAPIAPPEED